MDSWEFHTEHMEPPTVHVVSYCGDTFQPNSYSPQSHTEHAEQIPSTHLFLDAANYNGGILSGQPSEERWHAHPASSHLDLSTLVC